MKVKLARRTLLIGASIELVFQMLSAFDVGSLPGTQGDSSSVLERNGDTIIAEFVTTSGKRTYRTVEKVRLYPPWRITFRHLEGPLSFAAEEFTLVERDGCTELRYQGEVECRVGWLPGVGWLIARFYVTRKYDALIGSHMELLRADAEARENRLIEDNPVPQGL